MLHKKKIGYKAKTGFGLHVVGELGAVEKAVAPVSPAINVGRNK